MAKATFSQPSVRPRNTPLLLTAVGLAILFGLRLAFSGPAATVIRGVQWFLEYYAGVFALVALSISVMVGLVATDRLVLTARHRILLQAAHRGTAVASMAFLGIHVALKILEGNATFIDVVVPFLASHRVVFIGCGTIAGYLMLIVTWTGIIRGRFAGSAHPGIWRALHASAYVAWPFALVHGLQSGRPAAPWVTFSYAACVVFVLLALIARVCVTWGKRMRAPKATTSGTIRAVGKPVARPEPELIAPLPPPPAKPAPPPAPARRKPLPPRWEPAVSAPALPAGGRRHDDFGPYSARGPASRGRRARATRLGDGRPRPGVDMTDPAMPRYSVSSESVASEPVTAPPAAWYGPPAPDAGIDDRPIDDRRMDDSRIDDRRIDDSQAMPRLTFLDETDEAADGIPAEPRHARRAAHAAWDEREPYHTGAHPAVGRHSGEYRMVMERTGAQRPAWQAVLEDAPAYIDYEDADTRHAGRRSRADEPVSAPPVEPPRARRRHRAVPEISETPNDLPATRKAAVVLTDEEFWAHMRGEALR